MTAARKGRPKHPLDCHERALRLLSVRPRSRRELELRLLRAGFEPEEVSGELERLEAVGLVDDERFAREFAEHQFAHRRAGRRAVASGLAAKGVDRQAAERALAEAPGDDAARADDLARSRIERLHGVPPEKAFPRLVSFLVRRGHDPETARRSARLALGLEDGQVWTLASRSGKPYPERPRWVSSKRNCSPVPDTVKSPTPQREDTIGGREPPTGALR